MKDPEDIRAWQRLSSTITTSGRLQERDPARLAQLGIRHVVNLALDSHPEALAGEAQAMASAGLDYLHIPIPFDAPEPAHYERFKEAIAGAQGPVHVHCIMNWRVSALFYLLHLEHGMPKAEAREIMAKQWDPLTADEPYARPWADLIRRIAGAPRDL